VRQYGLEKLDAGAAQRLRLRHAEVYLQVVRQLDARLREGDAGAVAAGQAEMDNVREAVQWACQEPTLATAPTLAAEFARSVGRLWVQLGHWNEFLARAPVLRHSLQRLNDRPGEARLLDLCANILHRQGKHEAARDHAASALTLWRVCGHDRMAALLSNLAWYAFHAGDVEEARRLAAESLALARAEDDREAIGFTLAVQADLALAVGDADAARALTAEAGEHFTAVGDRAGAAIALERMGAAEQLAGVPDRARQRYLEALDLLRGLGYRFGVASVLFRLSALYGAREEAEDVEVEGVKQGPQSATREEPEPAQSEIAVALMALVARIDRELGAPHRHFALQDSAPTVYTESRYAVHSAPVSSYEEELDRLLPILRQPLSSRLDP
jgi:tetratricopeptide (TPR) repeat protein